MQSILQSLSFDASGTARLGPCPLGSVWTVLVSVPSASNSQSFEIFLMGTQVGSLQGTATYGPFQMAANQTVTVVSTGAALETGQTVTVMGQSDDAANAPTGIFPVVSGGVVTTAGTTPNLANQSVALKSNVAVSGGVPAEILTFILGAGTWLVNWQAEFAPSASSSVESVGVGVGPSSASFAGAYSVGGYNQPASISTAGAQASLAGAAIVVLTAPTNVYLNCSSFNALNVLAVDAQSGVGNATQMTAVQIA